MNEKKFFTQTYIVKKKSCCLKSFVFKLNPINNFPEICPRIKVDPFSKISFLATYIITKIKNLFNIVLMLLLVHKRIKSTNFFFSYFGL